MDEVVGRVGAGHEGAGPTPDREMLLGAVAELEAIVQAIDATPRVRQNRAERAARARCEDILLGFAAGWLVGVTEDGADVPWAGVR
ncbi:hypothetical protein [Sinomonas cyclohexanicum]|uniref:hypothetical protein n=1 Tax=Sinomonas cyclohexanicum TaxID=322009 RepID=UPI001E5E7CA9|nr:hypothetical protein [Corynebacterium cyclohexanicum]